MVTKTRNVHTNGNSVYLEEDDLKNEAYKPGSQSGGLIVADGHQIKSTSYVCIKKWWAHYQYLAALNDNSYNAVRAVPVVQL